jgi:small-conductance mechanosensitive channel
MEIIIRSIAIVAVTVIVMKISDFLFHVIGKRREKISFKFTQSIVKTVVVIAGIIAFSMQFEVTKELSSSLIRNTALLVAVLGFAAQQTLNDIISGFMLSWYKPFEIGERIHLVNRDITGVVENITLRHTIIRCFDNNRIIIPNSIINKEILKNSDYDDSVIGNYLEIGIDFQGNVKKAAELLDQVIRNHPSVITTERYTPKIIVKDVNREGFLLKATIWTKTVNANFEACSDIRIKVKEIYEKNGINII